VIYRLDLYYKTNAILFKEQIDTIEDGSLIAVKHIEAIGSQKEQCYFAISNDTGFTVW